MANYSYVIADKETQDALLVDPAYDPAGLLAIVSEKGLKLRGVILTHFHADHAGGTLYSGHSVSIAGIKELLELTDIPIHAQKKEAEWITKTTSVSQDCLQLHESGDGIELGSTLVTLLHTPGHTPGSQCVSVVGSLLTGDTLFLRGCGRTDLPGGDSEELYDSLFGLTKKLPPSTFIYPGHDYDTEKSMQLETLTKSNPVLRDVPKEVWVSRFAR
jgi:glyoxylase-like metal-dependent hydrolase (beta-lactamase superfamily II)